MTPDDPRHGTHAGHIAHVRSDTPMCEPCRTAERRFNKRGKLRRDRGVMNRVTLGQEAWDILDGCNRTQLHHATGLNRNMLSRFHRGGPEHPVLRSTRDKILAAKIAFTPIGIQRRIQALTAIGYSCNEISRGTGIHVDSIKTLRRGDKKIAFVRHDLAQQLVDYYENVCMTPLTVPRISERMRRLAARQRWVAPLAWDDIDTDAQPKTGIRKRRDTLGEYRWLREGGTSHHSALKQLDVTEAAVFRAIEREKVAA